MKGPAAELRLIASPFHDGLPGVDRGLGPSRLLDLGAAETLAGAGQVVSVRVLDPVDPGPEAARIFELHRRLAEHVRLAVAEDAFPLVLAGDCNSCLGTVAGAGASGLGVVWLDAHADFDTPDSSGSGSLDGMGLAMLTGHGWRALRETVSGLSPIEERNVLLIGVRDLDPDQRARLLSSGIRVLGGNAFTRGQLEAALDDLAGRVGRVYLHVDLDALDPSEGTANQYAAPGGLTTDRLLATIASVRERFEVAAAAVTAYNPDSDADGRVASAAKRIVAAVAEHGLLLPRDQLQG